LSRLNLATMAALSSGMPSTSVYLVLPSLRALIAASLMFSGVSKSGSPAESEMTSRPSALSWRAFMDTAMVADGWIRFRLSAKKPMSDIFLVGRKEASGLRSKPRAARTLRREPRKFNIRSAHPIRLAAVSHRARRRH